MKKSFAILTAFVLIMVMLFSACGGTDDMTTDPNLNSSNLSDITPSGDVSDSYDESSSNGGLIGNDESTDENSDEEGSADESDSTSKTDDTSAE